MRALVVASVICVSSVAVADDIQPPPWEAGIDYTVGRGGTLGALAYGWLFEAGGFFRTGPWQLTVSSPAWFSIHTSDPERDSSSLFGIGLGARLAYHVPLVDHGDGFVALGIEHQWLWGDGSVVRPCRLTNDCLAGYMTESVGYHAWAPEVRIGVGPQVRLPDGLLAASFELIGKYVRMTDVPPSGMHEVVVTGGVTMTLGWHRQRR